MEPNQVDQYLIMVYEITDRKEDNRTFSQVEVILDNINGSVYPHFYECKKKKIEECYVENEKEEKELEFRPSEVVSSTTSKRYLFKIQWDKFVTNEFYHDIGEFHIMVVVKNMHQNNSAY